jgi:glycosyltransferase involved in cell wall biosynthesis
MRKLRKLARRGRYDVVHSHVHHFSGLVLSAARAAMVPVRLAHSHNDTFALERNASLPRRSYLAFSEWLIQRNATAGVAASAEAARSLFGARWSSDARWSILYCGIALDPFRLPLAGKDLRSELGIPAGHLVVGHVGRFDPQKNHHFFAEVASEIARRHPAVHFLLVGDGPLRPTIQDAFAGKGLASQTTFAGLRGDVPQVMRCAMDLLLFPSHFEGLPLTLLEAQAASLPAVISDAISPETDVLPFCITRLSLSAQPSVWADAVLATASKGRPDRNTSLAALESSPFNAAASSTNLLSLYRKCLTAATAR